MTPRVWILSATGTYLPAIERVAREISLAGLIGLAPGRPEDEVSGYFDYSGWCAGRGLRHLALTSYGMTDGDDRAMLQAEAMDILLVLGWQRLVPPWLIGSCGAVVGVHGSAGGITAGRGRSPQNWALMLGRDSFSVSLFMISAGVDDGAVIDTRSFPLTPFDDIASSYWKMSLLVGEMVIAAAGKGILDGSAAQPQTGEAYYLPQRLPEDGAVDWSRSMADLHNFVRALTRPYPGAATTLEGRMIRIWRARPFMAQAAPQVAVGTVVDRRADGALLVRCGDGLLLIDEHDDCGGLAVPGVRLASASWTAQCRAIIQRHRAKYPDLPISPDILSHG